jgi:hypothetical protein
MSASPRDAHFYEQSKHAMNKEKVRITLIWLGQLDSNRDKINFNMFAEVDIWHDKAKKREF